LQTEFCLGAEILRVTHALPPGSLFSLLPGVS
jgi:hypothetical protein